MSGLQNIVKVVFLTACIAVLFCFDCFTCYAKEPICGKAVWSEAYNAGGTDADEDNVSNDNTDEDDTEAHNASGTDADEDNVSNDNADQIDTDDMADKLSDNEEFVMTDELYMDIYNEIGLNEVQYGINRMGMEDISFNAIFSGIKNNDFNYVKQSVWKIVKKITVEDILVNKQLIIQLILIALLGSVFVKLSGSFNGSFVSEQGFYVTYLIITSILLSSFLVSLDMVGDAIDSIISFVKIVIPVYALSMSFVGNTVSSVGMYELIMVGIWLVQIVISGVVLPMIKFYVIVSLVNNLNKEDSLSKLCTLVKNIVIWMLKTIVVFIAGLSIIKSLLEPQLDALGKNTINKIVSAIPGGGMGALITGTFLRAGVVIKNSIGIAGIIILGIIALAPVLKTFIIMMLIRVTAAMLQPIGEKRYVNGIETLASGMSLLLKAIGSSVALFMLVVAIMAYASSG